ncbi:MAG: PIN domain-containing protein [Terracidiphilus sp.]
MTEYVLDASALIRFLDNEPGARRVEEIITACASAEAEVCISAVQWGEVSGNLRKRFGASTEATVMAELLPSKATIVAVTADRAVRAAALKVDRKLAYADGFAMDLALDSTDRILVTADYGFKAVEDLARIEFLPAK